MALSSERKRAGQTEEVDMDGQHQHQHEPRGLISGLDDDPHHIALEDNPEKPETITWSTIFAILVSLTLP